MSESMIVVLFSIIVAVFGFVFGYLFGCGCQRGEDFKEINRIRKETKKALEDAFEKGKAYQKEADEQRAEQEFRIFCENVVSGTDFKIGDF